MPTPKVLDHIQRGGVMTVDGIRSKAEADKIAADARTRLERMSIELPPRSKPKSFAIVESCDRYKVDSWRVAFVFIMPMVRIGFGDEERAAKIKRERDALYTALLNVVRPSQLIERAEYRIK